MAGDISSSTGGAGAWPALIDRTAPGLFLVFWSSGFVGAKVGLTGAEPLTFLALRFAIVALILVVLALSLGARWPRQPAEIGHILMTGLLMQAIYFGACYIGFAAGVTAGGLALIVGMQPVVTACIAAPMLGERVRPVQILGLVLGAAGVALVLQEKLGEGLGTATGISAAIVALFAITLGTLYQKRFCPSYDLWAGGALQFMLATLVVGGLALAFEDTTITWSLPFSLALAYLVLINSIVAIALLTWMIRRGEAARVTSLFFLVPPTAALVAFLILDERLGLLALLGMAIAITGVALVMRPRLARGD